MLLPYDDSSPVIHSLLTLFAVGFLSVQDPEPMHVMACSIVVLASLRIKLHYDASVIVVNVMTGDALGVTLSFTKP